MAISVYTGVMGSGKTYEAVKNGIFPAIKAGRRVVTNIAGVDSEAIRRYLVDAGCPADGLGHVVVVENEAVLQPNFFPGESAPKLKFEVPDFVPIRELQHYADEYVLNIGKNFTKTSFQLLLPELAKLKERNIDIGSCLVAAALREWKTFQADWFYGCPPGEAFAQLPELGPSIVQPGDFVVIDEAWRYWSDLDKLTAEHMNFFRMHRHYVDSKGVACDLLVIIQDFASLNRFLRGVCELVLIFQKLKVLGFASRYRVEIYEGKPSKRTLVSTSPMQKYDSAIFPLYKSYDGVNGQESSTDSRQNLLKNKWFLSVMIPAILLFIYLGYRSYLYVHGLRHPEASETALNHGAGSIVAPGQANGVNSTNSSLASSNSDARIAGVFQPGAGETYVLFQLADGRFIRHRMDAGVIDGWNSEAAFQGRMATFNFSGKVSK